MALTSPPSGSQSAMRGAADAAPPQPGVIGQRWAALHQAASVVAMLAGLPAETLPTEARDFPAAIHAASGWRRSLVEQGLADMTAIMEPGLAALLAVLQRGADPAFAARALCEEFHAARAALLVLVPSTESAALPAS